MEHFYFLPIKEEIILDKGRRTIEGKHGICQYTNKNRRENREKEKATKQREAKTWKLSNPLTESTRDTPWKDTKLRNQRNHKLYVFNKQDKLYVSQQIGYKADYNFVCCI